MDMKYHETQFFQLPHANNIYSTCRADSKLFVASRRSLSILSARTDQELFNPKRGRLKPTPACSLEEITLSNVPDGSEFLSIDVSSSARVLALALREVKSLPGTMVEGSNFSLHFYGASSPNKSSWSRIAEDCQRLVVDYTPYCITHLAVSFNKTKNDIEDVFLVSGGDGKIHAYRMNKMSFMFAEIDSGSILPLELEQTKGKIIISMDIIYSPDGFRWSAFGSQSGTLLVARVPSSNSFVVCSTYSSNNGGNVDDDNSIGSVVDDGMSELGNGEGGIGSVGGVDGLNDASVHGNQSRSDSIGVTMNGGSNLRTLYYRNDGPNGVLICYRQLDGPIPHLSLFVDHSFNNTNRNIILAPLKPFFNGNVKFEEKLCGTITAAAATTTDDEMASTVDLIVSGAIGYGAMYQNLHAHHLSNPIILPKSSSHDSVLCTGYADLNLNGYNEIILGTYGQELLVYRFVDGGGGGGGGGGSGDKEKKANEEVEKVKKINHTKSRKDYFLDWQRTFAYPIYSINVGDFDDDGINELVITTLQGIHVLKPDLKKSVDKIEETIVLLEEIMALQKQATV
jgi:hypothetical protein